MKAKLYIWESGGGLSTFWDVPSALLTSAAWFFVFGRYGGGWAPLGRLDETRIQKASEGIRRAKELYDLDVELVLSSPNLCVQQPFEGCEELSAMERRIV